MVFSTGRFWRRCDGWRPKSELSFDTAQRWSASIPSWKLTPVAESEAEPHAAPCQDGVAVGLIPLVADEPLQPACPAPWLLLWWLCWDRGDNMSRCWPESVNMGRFLFLLPVIVSVGIYWSCFGRAKLRYRICEPKTREWAPGASWSQLTSFTGVSCIFSAT